MREPIILWKGLVALLLAYVAVIAFAYAFWPDKLIDVIAFCAFFTLMDLLFLGLLKAFASDEPRPMM